MTFFKETNDMSKITSEIERTYLIELSKNNQEAVTNTHFGLFSVFENEDTFTVPELTDEEKSRQLLFTKNHKLKNCKTGDKVINSKQEFEKFFDLITNNVFLCMNWDNVLIAGGAILSLLSAVPDSYKVSDEKVQDWYKKEGNFGDIDIFLYGLSDRQATKKIFEIYESIKNVIPKDILCVRGPRALTFVMGNPYRHIQIILRNFKTLAEVLLSFDVDSCAFGYDGETVWCSNRSHYAITHATNVVDISKKSSSYEYRLTKYGKRGYAVFVPNFTEDNLNEQIYLKQPHQLKGLAKLLVLEKLDDNVKFQIYRDVLDMHQASMRKNLNFKSEYEDSDYSKIYLPDWTENFTLQQIEKIMEQKHNVLNNIAKNNQLVFRNSEKNLNQTKQPEPIKHYCFYGKLNDVVMGKSVQMPKFELDEHRYYYEKTYVHGRLKFTTITDKEFKELGVFNASYLGKTDEDIYQWYQTAYYDSVLNKNTIIECVNLSEPEKFVEIMENGKVGKTSEEYLMWKKLTVNVRDIANRTPLHQAILKQDECMILLLLDYGADITYVSKLGKTALHMACEIGNVDMVKLLIESEQIKNDRSIINSQDSYKLTPILYALMYGNIEVFKYLYKYVESKDLIWVYKHDKTKSYRALKMCLLFRQYEIAKFLLKKKYDINDYYVNSNKSIHILEDSVKLFDNEMFNILISHHLSHDDSELTYKLENLQYLSKLLQSKYNGASKKQSRDYYAKFITDLYNIHGNKNALYELLRNMIEKRRFDDFKEYVVTNNVNLMVVGSDGKSLLDIVESKIKASKSSIVDNKNSIKASQQLMEANNATKYKYTTSELECNAEKIYIIPKWIIETELSHTITPISGNKKVAHKNEIEQFEKNVDNLVETIEYLDKVKKYLCNKGVVSFLKNSSAFSEVSKKNSNPVKSITKNVDICVLSSKGTVLEDQQIYFELIDDISKGSDLNEYELSEFDFSSYLSKSHLTPLQIAMVYEKYKTFAIILTHIVKNKKIETIQKSKKVTKNNLKLFKKSAQTNADTDSDDEKSGIENQPMSYDLNWELVYGVLKVIANTGLSISLTHFLNDISSTEELFCHVVKNIWKIINLFITEKAYNLVYEIIDFFDSNKIEIDMSSDTIISNIFNTHDIEGVCAYFKAIKTCQSYCKFGDDILIKYIESVKTNNLISDKILAKIVKYLVELCPGIINKQVDGVCPLHIASTSSSNMLEIILDHSPNMSTYNSDGYAAIHLATMDGNYDNLKLLVTNCPEHVNLQTQGQFKTPLMLAASFYSDIIELILSFKPNEDIVDIFGNTALHYGTIKSNLFLINKVKFHNKENYLRMTPADYIVNNYKSYFHHIRNEKLGLQLDKKKMSFIVEIYKKYIAGTQRERIPALYSNVVKVNKYILNSIPEGVNEIPDILKV